MYAVRYRLVRSVRTGVHGGFSLTIRPKRSGVYRARVGQSTACLGAASPPERVTVGR